MASLLMHRGGFKCIMILAYMLFVTKCQYTNIWNDSMSDNNEDQRWSASTTGIVEFLYDGQSCDTGTCVKLTADPEDAYVRRCTDVSRYETLEIIFDVETRSLESNDSCDIRYSYTSADASTSIIIKRIHPPNTNRTPYVNQVAILPSASSQNTVCIWLYATGSGRDFCYFDNVYLNGVRGITSNPTLEPIQLPTLDTVEPTKQPSLKPTNPNIYTCDDDITGAYTGALLTFIVHLPFDGDLQFDATKSSFYITAISIELNNTVIKTNFDQFGMIWLNNTRTADYKFKVFGDWAQNRIFHIQIRCVSANPTLAPTQIPTNNPTKYPTNHLSEISTVFTTNHPSFSPFNSATVALYPILSTFSKTWDRNTRSITAASKDDVYRSAHSAVITSVMLALLCCMCLCIVVGFGYRTKQREVTLTEEDKEKEIMMQMSENPDKIIRIKASSCDQVDNKKKDNNELQLQNSLVAQWLDKQVHLGVYLPLFLQNGFDSLEIIQHIKSEDELREIGIIKPGHVLVMMTAIRKLKKQRDNISVVNSGEILFMKAEVEDVNYYEDHGDHDTDKGFMVNASDEMSSSSSSKPYTTASSKR